MGGFKREVLLYTLCYVIPQCLCTGLHSQRLSFPAGTGIGAEHSACPQIAVGDNRFPGFYIMSQFKIAELARRGSVRKVDGSTSQHVAYSIGPAFNFRINTRSTYPQGLPEEFTFMTVFRMNGSTITDNWNIWQMQDLNGEEQLAVRLNGESRSLEFTFATLNKMHQTAIFPVLPFLFNSQWHKIQLNVRRRSVTLFVDCILIDSQNTPPRSTVNLDGYTFIGKMKDNPASAVRFELQSMLIHCDVRPPQTCADLPARTSSPHSNPSHFTLVHSPWTPPITSYNQTHHEYT
ncbi:collagen alpha-1(IX) chain [Esox lucius]|uniref:collagen alpha-1(IX) chain n=1 Tax=Esox lucius TaxID=8010 RepID=UPI0014776942|nr:collagen alpha-1(IX) chain [Esox lucius]